MLINITYLDISVSDISFVDYSAYARNQSEPALQNSTDSDSMSRLSTYTE